MGEATSDFLVFRINPYLAVTLGGVGLLVALLLQFSVKKYIPWRYWFTVVMVAVFGTMAADGLHISWGALRCVDAVFCRRTGRSFYSLVSKREKPVNPQYK